MTPPDTFEKRRDDAADAYATGNHRTSFADTYDEKAFKAGADWGYAEVQAELADARKENYADDFNYAHEQKIALKEKVRILEDEIDHCSKAHQEVGVLWSEAEDKVKVLTEALEFWISNERKAIPADWMEVRRKVEEALAKVTKA